MTFFAYILIGIIVGVIVRFVLPPTPLVRFWGSVLLGLVGGIIGGLISSAILPYDATSRLHPLGITLAILVSAAVTTGVTLVTRKRRFA